MFFKSAPILLNFTVYNIATRHITTTTSEKKQNDCCYRMFTKFASKIIGIKIDGIRLNVEQKKI